MGSTKAPAPDTSSPPPPPDSDSSTSPPPEKSSPPPPSSPPPSDSSPPPPKTSPPPPEKSSPPPAKLSPPPSPPAKTPPTPENSSPPPSNASPPPSSPSPPALSPPPTPAKKIPPTPIIPETPPAPEGVVTNSPPPPAEGGAERPPAPAGDLIKSPPGMPFVPPPPAVPSNQSASSSSPPHPSGGSSVPGAAIAGAIVGGLVIFILLVCLWMFCKRKKKTQEYYNKVWNTPSPDYKHHAINIPRGLVGMTSPVGAHLPPKSPAPGAEGGYSPYFFPNRSPGRQSPVPISPDRGGFSNQNHLPYDDVVSATDGFANANMLGQGGFGLVHKGVLPGGKQVAVKSLKSGSGQGEREFQAEVDIISRVHHRHLVSLVGYCIAADKRLLVYEFVPNNTLEYHLHKSGKSPLDFPTRVRIALGSAKGLAYLHEDCHPRIIHRDIKAANILLDYNFEAQVADFGLARLYNDTNTHVSTRVMGTFGYLAPEYASSGKLTDKSDVFSFGVVLLELITGRRPVDPNDQSMEDCSLVDWARPLLAKALAEGHYDELVDSRLERNYNVQDMESMVACAAASIRHSGKRRPRMSQIMRTLEGDMSLEGLDGTRTVQGAQSNTEYDTATYNADLKKFRQMAFGTQTFGGGSTTTTSEYGLNPSASSSNVTSPRESANSSL